MNATRALVGGVLVALVLSCGSTEERGGLANRTYGLEGGDIGDIQDMCTYQCRNGWWEQYKMCLSNGICPEIAQTGCSDGDTRGFTCRKGPSGGSGGGSDAGADAGSPADAGAVP